MSLLKRFQVVLLFGSLTISPIPLLADPGGSGAPAFVPYSKVVVANPDQVQIDDDKYVFVNSQLVGVYNRRTGSHADSLRAENEAEFARQLIDFAKVSKAKLRVRIST